MPIYQDLDAQRQRVRSHSIHLDDRARMSVTGVLDVQSFDEQDIDLLTEAGPLLIEGEGLHITKLSLEEGLVQLEGDVVSMEYQQAEAPRRGLFGRILH